MAIDAEFIKANTDIVAVVSHYVPLKKSGIHYIGLCPFHADKNPSFYVTPSKRYMHCFGCEIHLDVIEFLREAENLDFVQACERLGVKKDWKRRVAVPTAPPIPQRITSKPPPDTPSPSMSFRDSGEPAMIFPLRDVDGSLIAYEARYNKGDTKSLMWTWGHIPGRAPRWACGALNAPRPMYGLHRLRDLPDAGILITEGPKKAEAAQRLLGTRFVSLSLTGGANAMRKHDYSLIAGKHVLLWPDADSQRCKTEKDAEKYGCSVGDLIPYRYQPGQKCMFDLAEKLQAIGCRVRIVDVTGMPDGWDVADGDAEGWTPDSTWEWLQPRIKKYPACEADYGKKLNGHSILERGSHNYHTAPEMMAMQSPQALAASLGCKKVSDYKQKPIKWLWKNRIAKGKISLLVGNPGLGKSQTCASIAAIVSTGGFWPDAVPAHERVQSEVGNVLILSSEDDPEDTTCPRMTAAGADPDRVHLLGSINERGPDETPQERAFSVKSDLARLGAKMDEIGNVRLLIIDPISAFMGDADSYKDSDVRALLTPLSIMAAERNFAVLLISHLTKAQGNSALLRVQGSVALVAAARAVWGVSEDPDDPERRLFVSMKNNIGRGNTGLAFRIQSVEIPSDEGPIETSRVMWEDEIVTMGANEAMNTSAGSIEEQEERSDAKSFLRSLLHDGPVPATTVAKEAKSAGYTLPMMNRAKRAIGADSIKEDGVNAPWVWYLKGHGRPPRNSYAERRG